ncbi:MAG TPA: NYN domain-containing protein, partial [Pyrinomonadaceae bacterium]|nr:NYN domain-containing protein [Pyrinomonadaceae bacterium]
RRARRGLLEELARFAREAGVKASAVFDGAPDEHFPDGSSFMGVRVFYAERGSDADARIRRMVDESRERRTLVVVTSDRALADYVRRSGARVMRSGEFRRRMEESKARGQETKEERPPARARAGDGAPDADLDGWMRYFGASEEDEEGNDER